MEPRKRQKRSQVSPGGTVIAMTGWAALIFMGPEAESRLDYMIIAAIVAATAAGAWAMNRLVERHGNEIGEARFDTRNDR